MARTAVIASDAFLGAHEFAECNCQDIVAGRGDKYAL